VLDTHILIWWATGDFKKLSLKAEAAINQELQGGEIIISSITAWEIAMLIAKERIVISMDLDEWLSTIEQIEAVKFLPVDNDIAMKSANLPGEFHKDPADRMIVATARKLGCVLVTADEKILNYQHVKTFF
jgi:PIN domain nuclease of toxin-antitoxin system